MLFNNTSGELTSLIKTYLGKGEHKFDLDFSGTIVDKYKIEDIVNGFQGERISVKNLVVRLFLGNTRLEDEDVVLLTSKLTEVQWPDDTDFELVLSSNLITDNGIPNLIKFVNHMSGLREGKLAIDLDNNRLTELAIQKFLEDVENCELKENWATNGKNVTVEFSKYLVQNYLESLEKDDDS